MGKTLKIDAHSLDGERRRYAAICVLMEEGKRVPLRALIGWVKQEIVCGDDTWTCNLC